MTLLIALLLLHQNHLANAWSISLTILLWMAHCAAHDNTPEK